MSPPVRNSGFWLVAGFAACLFGVILGAKWAIFARYGSPMPDWDQWDAEGGALLIPWFEGRNFLEEFLYPHNEHRVIVTKLQTLALTLANGQWDSRLLAVFNAVLHSAIGVALWLVIRRGVPLAWQAGLFVLTAALFALPFAWQNTLGGFHSQQYWLVGLSMAAIVSLPFARAGSIGWWAAALVTAAALLTMGSGLLAAATVLVVLVFRTARRQDRLRDILPTLLVAVVVVAIGLLTRVEMPGHAGLKARTLHDFVISTAHSMEWPLRHHEWAAFVLWLPWGLLLWRIGQRDLAASDERYAQTLAAIGGWAMLQIAATSYARGAGADYPASRYMDTLAIGALANGAALAWLASRSDLSRRPRLALGLLTAAWVALLTRGLYRETDDAFVHHLPGARQYYDKAESYLRGYLATNDPVHFSFPEIPYPSADGLIDRLSNPHLRALMPAIVRAPLPLRPAERRAPAGSAFIENAAMSLQKTPHPNHGLSPKTVALEFARTWGSFGPAGTATTGEWRSAPVSSPLGAWLKFETAGHVGEPGVALELRDAASDALLATVKPTRVPGDRWRAAYVRAPAGKFVVVARDSSASGWLAFAAPVEFGRLSYGAWRACQHGLLILNLAAGATGGLTLLALGRRRRQAASSPVAPATPAVSIR